MRNSITISVLITTMNENIFRVQSKLLQQLVDTDEIIISHQITDGKQYFLKNFPKNVKYVSMNGKWLSKNRNNALKYATSDVCYICDDDLDILPNFVRIIRDVYQNSSSDVITFQAIDEKWRSVFRIKPGKHNIFSVLRVWSWGITFRREKILQKNIFFDENFGLWAKYPVSEENIFLSECLKNKLKIEHSDEVIVSHSSESSGILYRDELIVARVQVFKKIFGFLGGAASIFYFWIFHYSLYKEKIWIQKFLKLSLKSLFYEK